MVISKQLTANQKRCQDCVNLQTGWKCAECFGQSIENIDDCPEGMTLEEQDALDEKAKANRVLPGASSDKPKKKSEKPKTKPVSDEKKEVFATILANLQQNFDNVEVANENKLIFVRKNGKTIKIDLVETKKA